jgi:hypothetical protein
MFDPTQPSKSHLAEKLAIVSGTHSASKTKALDCAVVEVAKQH